MKNLLVKLSLIAVTITAAASANATCYAYRWYMLKDKQLTCVDKSEVLATLCITEENVKPFKAEIANLSSGTYSIQVTTPKGLVIVQSKYHMKQERTADGRKKVDYRPGYDNFKYLNAESVPYFKLDFDSRSTNAPYLTIGERTFCTEVVQK